MNEISIQNYLVAFIDLLGQRAQMEGLLFMPPTTEAAAREDFIKRIRPSIEAVRFVRTNFQTFVNTSNNHHLTPLEGLDKNLSDEIQKYRLAQVGFQQFSDGIVLFCSLREDGHYPLHSAWRMLQACAAMMLGGMAHGFPFRAGIAIGAGCTLDGNDIYGPVLAEAYRLESTVASYPRVVLSNEVLDWLKSYQQRTHDSQVEGRIAVALQSKCEELLMRDIDDVLAIDYLKHSTLKDLGGDSNTSPQISGMKKFISESLARYASSTCEEDRKIREKYEKVERYIQSRPST